MLGFSIVITHFEKGGDERIAFVSAPTTPHSIVWRHHLLEKRGQGLASTPGPGRGQL